MKQYELSELGTIVTGNTPSTKVEEYYDRKDIKFIKPNDVQDGYDLYLDNSVNYISNKAKEKARLVPEHSVLVTCIGIIGKVAVTKETVAFNQQINAIIPNEKVLPEYLALKLKFERENLNKLANKSVVSNINKTNFSKYKISIPTIERQKKTLKIIRENISIISKRQQQIEALSALKQSVFLDMFGDPILNTKNWEIVKLSDIGKWQSGGTPSRKRKEYYRGEIPWLSSGELNNIYISNSNEYITKNAIEESSAKLIAKNSLLLGMYDTAGLKSSINLVECSCNQAIAFAEIDEKYAVTEFVYYTIQIMREYLLNQQRGVRQKNFNLTMIKNIEIISPPVDLQQKFLDKVNIVFDKEKELERSLVLIKKLFNSTLYKAFNGELFKEEIKA